MNDKLTLQKSELCENFKGKFFMFISFFLQIVVQRWFGAKLLRNLEWALLEFESRPHYQMKASLWLEMMAGLI